MNWQDELRSAVRSTEALQEHFDFDLKLPKKTPFPLMVTNSFLSRIDKGNPRDPLLRQILPSADSSTSKVDPVGDQAYTAAPGIIQKYQGRSLVVATSACAIHCQYCFRKNYPYERNVLDEDWTGLLADSSEIILSGGDPLCLSDRLLVRFLRKVDELSQIKTVRIHTRVPVVLPSRIDSDLMDVFSGLRQRLVIVIHVNHPNEIDADVSRALSELRSSQATLLNQSVLLKGVNDRSSTLIELSECLFENGVLPYYLHKLDPVTGSSEFSVNDDRALTIVEEMRSRLPGYLVPKFVEEIPGRSSKVEVSWK